MLLASLSPNFAGAQVVPNDDKRLKTEMLTYASPGGSGTMKGYLATPEQAASLLASETKRWGDIIRRAKIPTQ